MTGSGQPPSVDEVTGTVSAGTPEQAVACLEALETADVDTRKRALRGLRSVAEENPEVFADLAEPLATFLDDDRAVRLTTAKLFVTIARSRPAATLAVAGSLKDRLEDDEFYYVRARCAEALGYVALEYPEAVDDPETLADFRVGLAFDEPEVREKLAKALAYVAFGDPDRLRHQLPSLAEHLDDERELVRYYLCSTLVAVGCEHPEKLLDLSDALRVRLGDESPYVRGRTLEAIAVLARWDTSVTEEFDLGEIDHKTEETPAFLTTRVQFARRLFRDGQQSVAAPEGLGTVESIRAGTEAVVEEITAPDSNGECPHCGLELPDDGPPICPQCGTPR